MLGLRFVEAQLGMKWQQALEDLSAGGAYLAFDAETQGVALLIKAAGSDQLSRIKDKVISLARKDAESKGKPDPFQEKTYRSLTAYGTGQGGFYTYQDWLVLINKSELGKSIADALLDGRSHSLATNDHFQMEREAKSPNALAWGFVQTEPFRHSDDEGLRKLFSGQADDPGGELILGGLLEALKQTPTLSASILARERSVALQVQVPFERSSVAEEREHFFGARGEGEVKTVLNVPGSLGSIAVYRNVAEMWLRAGDLFDGRVNDNLAQADATLTTLFSGKDFAEDILGALQPEFQIIAVRQEFPEDRPIPAIKIPAFAILAEMIDPETTAPEFRRIFQSFIGFLNIVGAMEGNPQLDLGFGEVAGGELISATFVPDVGEEADRQARIQFNFSPTLAYSKDRLVLASSVDLARSMATAEADEVQRDPDEKINSLIEIKANQLRHVLDDNRSHLIAQNMLKEGHTRDEAEHQIATLLAILDLFERASLQLKTSTSQLTFELELTVK